MHRLLLIPLAVAALAFAACGDDEDSSEPAEQPVQSEQPDQTAQPESEEPEESEKPEKPQPAGITITTGDSQFGTVLFDEDQRTIYYFDKETSGESECYGACAEAWPPVLTEGDPQASGGAEHSLLGTTERDDGTTQVTYDGRPIYYYHDEPAGQVLCHNVDEFGGLWLAVEPGGAPVA